MDPRHHLDRRGSVGWVVWTPVKAPTRDPRLGQPRVAQKSLKALLLANRFLLEIAAWWAKWWVVDGRSVASKHKRVCARHSTTAESRHQVSRGSVYFFKFLPLLDFLALSER